MYTLVRYKLVNVTKLYGIYLFVQMILNLQINLTVVAEILQSHLHLPSDTDNLNYMGIEDWNV